MDGSVLMDQLDVLLVEAFPVLLSVCPMLDMLWKTLGRVRWDHQRKQALSSLHIPGIYGGLPSTDVNMV